MEHGFSVSALGCPLATPTVLPGFLLPWTWGISSQMLQQSAAAAPYLGRGVLLTTAPPDPECGVAPLGPPVSAQPLLLGCGVSPLATTPDLGHGVLQASAPDLGRVEAPLSPACAPSQPPKLVRCLENSAVATGLEKIHFHSNRKERQCERMLKLPHNCTHLTR